MSHWTRLQKVTICITLLYACVFVFMLIIHPDPRHFYDAFFNTYQILAPLFAGIAGLIYYQKGRIANPIRRRGWLLVALSSLSFAAGQSTWTYLESVKGILVPFPSWADAGYLGTYPLLIAGVMLLFGTIPVAGRTRQLLDSAIAASSLGALSWVFIIQRVWYQSDVSLVGKCISIAYPLFDIAALFGAVVLLSNAKQSNKLRRSLYFIAAGILGFTLFDTSFTLMSLNGTYQTGSWSDWAMSFGWIMVGYSFLNMMWWPKPELTGPIRAENWSDAQAQSIRQIITPYVAVIVACLVIGIHDYSAHGFLQGFSVFAVMILMMLVMTRQILALVENRMLTLRLKGFNDNLERIVKERTKELEKQNQTILAMVEERNRFYRHVSHEVRTPLTSIIGFTELMADDDNEPLTPGQKSIMQKVTGSAHRLLNMINNLLDISRIEAGRMEVHYNDVRLDELVEQVVDHMMPLASEKGLEITVSVKCDTPLIITDEQKLIQILTNLLSNAVKYTHEGTIKVNAASECGQVTISVIDTGVGIPEDELANIFKEFHRVQVGPIQRGSGLGLTIVQKLTELLEGSVTVQSKLHEGSTFILTLPNASNYTTEIKDEAGCR